MDQGLGPSRCLAWFHVQRIQGKSAWKCSQPQAGTESGNILDTFYSLLNFCQLCIWYCHKGLLVPPPFFKNETSFPFCEREDCHSRPLHPLCCCSAFLPFCSCTSLGLHILGFGNSPGNPGMGRVAPLNVTERLLHFNRWSSTENFLWVVTEF